jgi:WD40 repeat protein
MATHKCLFSSYSHERFVRGISFDYTGNYIYSCGDDQDINIYSVNQGISKYLNKQEIVPTVKLVSKTPVQSIDCSYVTNQFVTGGEIVQLWSQDRSNPIQTFNWVQAINSRASTP